MERRKIGRKIMKEKRCKNRKGGKEKRRTKKENWWMKKEVDRQKEK